MVFAARRILSHNPSYSLNWMVGFGCLVVHVDRMVGDGALEDGKVHRNDECRTVQRIANNSGLTFHFRRLVWVYVNICVRVSRLTTKRSDKECVVGRSVGRSSRATVWIGDGNSSFCIDMHVGSAGT